MTPNKQTAEELRAKGFSADSIALNFGITLTELAELEKSEPSTWSEIGSTRKFARCAGALL
jgi:hypothetical protein